MNTFIFDLDGTLLPMPSQEKFLDLYMSAVSKKVKEYGMDSKKLLQALMAGTMRMVKNDGTMTNEERFWEEFCDILGDDARRFNDIFDDFYRNEFVTARSATSTHPLAAKCMRRLKEKGYQVVLATNPLFPRIATHTRIAWAGLDPKDFDLITTYENCTYSKPNLDYYKEVLANIKRKPEECIMVGNDVTEDMCAAHLGMDTFLLKDCLICPEGEDIANFKQGGFDDLFDLIDHLPQAQEC